MRRFFASLLVAVFSFSLIAPAVSAKAEAKLHACCRLEGKHHCGTLAVRQAGKPSSEPSAVAARCLLFPSANAVPPSQFAGLPGIARVMAVGFFNHSVSIERAETFSRISYSQAGLKRGPPVYFL